MGVALKPEQSERRYFCASNAWSSIVAPLLLEHRAARHRVELPAARAHRRQPPRRLRHRAPTVACHARPHRHHTLRVGAGADGMGIEVAVAGRMPLGDEVRAGVRERLSASTGADRPPRWAARAVGAHVHLG
jgi:hypothetical protein